MSSCGRTTAPGGPLLALEGEIPDYTPLENAGRLLIKHAPGKRFVLEQMQKLQGLSLHVPSFYWLLTPLLQLTTGSHNFHGGIITRGTEDWHEAQLSLTRRVVGACGLLSAHVVLDLGCGIGGPAVDIAGEVGCRVHGVNISRSQLKRAEEHASKNLLRNKVYLTQADAQHLPFRWSQFHHAYAMESLSHMPDKAKVVSEVARVLLPGGRFAIVDACLFDPASLESDPDFTLFNIGWGIRPEDWIRQGVVLDCFRKAGLELVIDEDLTPQVGPAARAQAAYAGRRESLFLELYGSDVFNMVLQTLLITARYVESGWLGYRLWVGQR